MVIVDLDSEQFREMMESLTRQNKEFDALTDLASEWEKLRRVAVVDDAYPEQRHNYENALNAFIEALKNNKRI